MSEYAEKVTQKISVISWDLDGTLYDANAMKRQLLKLWLQNLWRPSTWFDIKAILASQKMVKAIHKNGGHFRSNNRGIKGSNNSGNSRLLFDRQVRLLAEQAELKWFSRALINTGLRQNVAAAIDYFAQQGFQQIVVSDYRPDYKLDALGLADSFQYTFACENYGALKPSPNVFNIVCRELDVHPQEILHIGDRRDTDGIAAQSAGCLFYYLSPSATFDVENFRDFSDLLL